MGERRESYVLSTGFAARVARHRKTINENLGLLVALLAAGFAGWSAWEAEKTREDAHADAIYALKVAQRSYVRVEEPRIESKSLGVSESYTLGVTAFGFNVKTYGNSPALDIHVTVRCKLDALAPEIDYKEVPTPFLVFNGDVQIPSIIAGNSVSGEAQCEKAGAVTTFLTTDLAYGEVDYKDIFGDSHYTHFCYIGQPLDDRIVSDKPEQQNKTTSGPQQNLKSCNTYNDSN